ncbi:MULTISPECIES: hypothetical protein [unclassified Microcoleus]
MNSLLLISPDRSSGFKPILSGNSNAKLGKLLQQRLIVRDRHLGL